METLEPGVMLDASEAAIELFSTSPAVFVENAGQWADPDLRYVFQGDGATIGFTDAGPVFNLFRREAVGAVRSVGPGRLNAQPSVIAPPLHHQHRQRHGGQEGP